MKLFIDDERDPVGDDWTICRSYSETIRTLTANKDCPQYISFDHDLGPEEMTGYDIAKWIVNFDIKRAGTYIPFDFDWYVHSQNPVGRDNINGLLSNYLGVKKNG